MPGCILRLRKLQADAKIFRISSGIPWHLLNIIFDTVWDIVLAYLRFEPFTMTFHTLCRNNRNCLMTVADVLGLATIVMLVFLTTCQVTSPTPHVAAAKATTILGDHYYDYQSLLSKIAGGGWKPPRSRCIALKALDDSAANRIAQRWLSAPSNRAGIESPSFLYE
ncbi:MAG: hypothetical protein FRX48_05417 [Lasallia pustulata]|uniref:Uncharacterized protein n=1 Tax=Lasallia pustulata TaxID=136370 RepID=A0A5M8PNR4_9LECA|nr:MAG: hypothetical protein FRX48_05417 [Lasallia pustulata]